MSSLLELVNAAETVVDEFFAFYEHDRPELTNSTIEAMRRLRTAIESTKEQYAEQLPPHTSTCDWCGETAFCNRYQLGSRELETGYIDVQTLCQECSKIFEEEIHDRQEHRARAHGVCSGDDDR